MGSPLPHNADWDQRALPLPARAVAGGCRLGSPLPTSAPGLGSPSATSAPGLGSPLPTSAPGLQLRAAAGGCWLGYVVCFHNLANMPTDDPLYLGILQRFWTQVSEYSGYPV
jgi:hypothetical protein